MKPALTLLILLLLLILTACSAAGSAAPAVSTAASPSQEKTSTSQITPGGTLQPATSAAEQTASPLIPATPNNALPTPTQLTAVTPAAVRLPSTPLAVAGPIDWQNLPVIPAVSDTAVAIYQRGVELGNNPQAFSKVGDCGSTPAWFLGDFDRGPKNYSLGSDYQDLTGVIQAFQGSYARTSLAARAGFNASSVFTSLWADRSQCQANETPLACEYRIQRPAVAFVMLGSNDVWHKDEFEPQMRKIIEYSIDNGVLPILSTKADNDEKDGSINATIARLAQEYDLPLLNFWRAVQSLPDQGLQPDGVHITWGPNRFDDKLAMQRGWTVRNLTALQALDAVWKRVNNGQ